jgi:hypothetical protein
VRPMRVTVVTNETVITVEVDRYIHENDVSYLENPRPVDEIEKVAGATFDWLVLIDGSEIGRFVPAKTSLEEGPLGPRLVIRK